MPANETVVYVGSV